MSESWHLPQRLIGDLVEEVGAVLPLTPELPPARLQQVGGQVVDRVYGAVLVGGEQGTLDPLRGGGGRAGHVGRE